MMAASTTSSTRSSYLQRRAALDCNVIQVRGRPEYVVSITIDASQNLLFALVGSTHRSPLLSAFDLETGGLRFRYSFPLGPNEGQLAPTSTLELAMCMSPKGILLWDFVTEDLRSGRFQEFTADEKCGFLRCFPQLPEGVDVPQLLHSKQSTGRMACDEQSLCALTYFNPTLLVYDVLQGRLSRVVQLYSAQPVVGLSLVLYHRKLFFIAGKKVHWINVETTITTSGNQMDAPLVLTLQLANIATCPTDEYKVQLSENSALAVDREGQHLLVLEGNKNRIAVFSLENPPSLLQFWPRYHCPRMSIMEDLLPPPLLDQPMRLLAVHSDHLVVHEVGDRSGPGLVLFRIVPGIDATEVEPVNPFATSSSTVSVLDNLHTVLARYGLQPEKSGSSGKPQDTPFLAIANQDTSPSANGGPSLTSESTLSSLPTESNSSSNPALHSSQLFAFLIHAMDDPMILLIEAANNIHTLELLCEQLEEEEDEPSLWEWRWINQIPSGLSSEEKLRFNFGYSRRLESLWTEEELREYFKERYPEANSDYDNWHSERVSSQNIKWLREPVDVQALRLAKMQGAIEMISLLTT